MKKEAAVLPLTYDTYVFDLYGTLVDIHTDENAGLLWEKLALFYGYYRALYTPQELKAAYERLVKRSEMELKRELEVQSLRKADAHEASPEIDIVAVFRELYREKGAEADERLAVYTGQFFRVLATEYVRLYPGTAEMLASLRKAGKKVYLLSNAQRIFTEYEMHTLGIADYFDGILISSDHRTRKPDISFFRLLESEYAVDPSKTLFIGNDSVNDIGGAGAAGYDTFYVKSNISPKGDAAPEADYAEDCFTHWGY